MPAGNNGSQLMRAVVGYQSLGYAQASLSVDKDAHAIPHWQ